MFNGASPEIFRKYKLAHMVTFPTNNIMEGEKPENLCVVFQATG